MSSPVKDNACKATRELSWHALADDRLAKLERGLIVVFLALLILFSLFNIVARVLWGGASQTVSETIPMLVLWLALLGGSLAVRHNRHIRFQLLRSATSTVLQGVVRIFIALLGCLVLAVIALIAVAYAISEMGAYGWQGGAALAYPYFCLSAGFRFGRALFRNAPAQDGSR